MSAISFGAVMKKFVIGVVAIAALMATPAVAADMATKAPPAPAAAPYSWTGFYLGSEFGAGWGGEDVAYSANDPASAALLNGGTGFVGEQPVAGVRVRQAGPVSGLEAGYNWLTGANWLLGLEADFSVAKIDGRGSSTSIFAAGVAGNVTHGVTAQQKTDWYGTVRGRIGWLVTPNFLVFGTGGFAYGRVAGSALTLTECSAKYKDAKAAGTLNGTTWNDFRKSQCDAGTSGGAAKASAGSAGTIVVAANAVFPTAVDAKYSNEKPGRARRKTCLDRYKANKANNANGGLKCLQRGGGYYSQCVKKLKGAA
jgi:outer membrane immunogenic protein